MLISCAKIKSVFKKSQATDLLIMVGKCERGFIEALASRDYNVDVIRILFVEAWAKDIYQAFVVNMDVVEKGVVIGTIRYQQILQSRIYRQIVKQTLLPVWRDKLRFFCYVQKDGSLFCTYMKALQLVFVIACEKNGFVSNTAEKVVRYYVGIRD